MHAHRTRPTGRAAISSARGEITLEKKEKISKGIEKTDLAVKEAGFKGWSPVNKGARCKQWGAGLNTGISTKPSDVQMPCTGNEMKARLFCPRQKEKINNKHGS